MTRLLLVAGSYLTGLVASAILLRSNVAVEPNREPLRVIADASHSDAKEILTDCQRLASAMEKADRQLTPRDFHDGIDLFKKHPTQAAAWLAAEVRAPERLKSVIAQWIGAVATTENPIHSYEAVRTILENAWGKDHAVLRDAESVFLSQLIENHPRLALELPNAVAGMADEWRTSARIRMISLYGPSACRLSPSEITSAHMGSLSDLLMRWPEDMTAALTGESAGDDRQEFFRRLLAGNDDLITDEILIPVIKACGLSEAADALRVSARQDTSEPSRLMDSVSRIRAALGDGVAKHMLAQRFKNDPRILWTSDFSKTENSKLANEALSESIREDSGFALALLTAGREFGAQQENKAFLMGECAAALNADQFSEANFAAVANWSSENQKSFWSAVFRTTGADVAGILDVISPESKTAAVLGGLSRNDADPITAAAFLNAVAHNTVAPDPNDAERLGEKLARYYPTETASWALTLDGKQQQAAISGVTRSWAETDAEAASDWVDKLARGRVKDAAAAALAPAIIWDFAGAVTWAGAIEEPELREKTFRLVLQARQDAYGDAANQPIPPDVLGRFRTQ